MTPFLSTGLAALLLAVQLVAPAGALGAQEVSEARVREALGDAAASLGGAIAGGSPLTGPASTTGGFGGFRIGAAGILTDIEIENPDRAAGTIGFGLPAGFLTGAVGLWGGDPATGLGSIDVIGRLGTVLPREDLSSSPVAMSLGVRVGLLAAQRLLPDASVSVTRTRTGDLEYGDENDRVSFSGEISTVSLRIDVSKRFVLVTPYAGAGFDRSQLEADYRIPDERSTGGDEIEGSIESSDTRGRAYAGIELALALFSVSVEAGTAGGESFGAVGFRLGS